MSSGKCKRNLFYIVKQYFENLKQVKLFLKPALLESARILQIKGNWTEIELSNFLITLRNK